MLMVHRAPLLVCRIVWCQFGRWLASILGHVVVASRFSFSRFLLVGVFGTGRSCVGWILCHNSAISYVDDWLVSGAVFRALEKSSITAVCFRQAISNFLFGLVVAVFFLEVG